MLIADEVLFLPSGRGLVGGCSLVRSMKYLVSQFCPTGTVGIVVRGRCFGLSFRAFWQPFMY